MSKKQLLNTSINAAKASTFHRAQVGAVIVKGRKLLATGTNKIAPSKHHPYKESRHAEVDAVMHVLKRKKLEELNGATIYVTRILKSGNLANAFPCQACMRLIRAVGIKKIIYSFDDGLTYTFNLSKEF